jgi:hypothetical protein
MSGEKLQMYIPRWVISKKGLKLSDENRAREKKEQSKCVVSEHDAENCRWWDSGSKRSNFSLRSKIQVKNRHKPNLKATDQKL